MARKQVTMTVDVVFDDDKTDAESISNELDRMMDTIKGIMGPDWFADYGNNVEVLSFSPLDVGVAEREQFINNLAVGDEITWNDPDFLGDCTRTFVIRTMERKGNIFIFTADDGWEIECLAEEIS